MISFAFWDILVEYYPRWLLMKPILKWVGGKTALLEEIKRRMPKEYGTYYEPFIGGGAIFLNIETNKAVINDKNEELINCYIQVRDHLNDLIPMLNELQNEHSEEKYYELRSVFNLRKAATKNGASLELYDAALMIYLNKAGFNGMYRENLAGSFNIPSGKRKEVNLYDLDNLCSVSRRLKQAKILSGDFEDALHDVKYGDFVYFDSPYDETFNTYQRGGFTKEDHERLASLCNRLTDKNVRFLLSSSDSNFIRELYRKYEIIEIDVQRMIGFKGKRKKERELLIRNY